MPRRSDDAITTIVGEGLMLVTDGFWAELNEDDQARFVDGCAVIMP